MKKHTATSVTAAFAVSAMAKIIFLLSCVMQYLLLSRTRFTLEEAQANDTRQRIIAFINPLIALTAIVILFVWLYPAKKKVIGLGMSGSEYSPGFTVGCFFIPIGNLVLPFLAVRELWQGSKNPVLWKDQASHPIVGWWWGFWLVNSVFAVALFVLHKTETGREGLKIVTLGLIVSAAFAIASCALTIGLVRGIAAHINQSQTVPAESSLPNQHLRSSEQGKSGGEVEGAGER